MHAIVLLWSMRFWESARLQERVGRSSDSQDRMDLIGTEFALKTSRTDEAAALGGLHAAYRKQHSMTRPGDGRTSMM